MTVSVRRLAVLVHALLVVPLVAVFVVVGSGQPGGLTTVLLSIPVLLGGAPWSILTAQFTENASPDVFEFLSRSRRHSTSPCTSASASTSPAGARP